jgi:hypothetical protein
LFTTTRTFIYTFSLKPQVADFREQIAATFQLNEEKKEIDFFHKFFPVSLVEKIIAETNA